jgi:hypothetical protein
MFQLFCACPILIVKTNNSTTDANPTTERAAAETTSSVKLQGMSPRPRKLSDWSAEEIALGRKWIQTWKAAGPELERIRREELRQIDSIRAISNLCGVVDYTVPPRVARPTSGLIEQQRWFMKAFRRD